MFRDKIGEFTVKCRNWCSKNGTAQVALYDVSGGEEQYEMMRYKYPDLEEVSIDVPTWKLCTVLNDQVMYQGENPLGFDSCPFIPVFWNYEPHINYYAPRLHSN